MLFDMSIPASEFQQKQLKVLASIPLQVMIKELDQVTYQFTTVPDQMMYDLAEYLSEDSLVEVKLIPGSVVEFYPVVNAL
ncbi:hypothetical protein [Enterococcus sp.]|uniref:hypothetical protein n=1 Tax=Enterococcus sp. TaxID=35783 RepID=UPI0028ABEE3C|nr:hypothetical protein [Enterococcus sp.]